MLSLAFYSIGWQEFFKDCFWQTRHVLRMHRIPICIAVMIRDEQVESPSPSQ